MNKTNKESDDKLMYFEVFIKYCQKIGIYDVSAVQDIFDSIDFRKTGQISIFNFTYI